MISILRIDPGGVTPLTEPADGCWVRVAAPTPEDLARLDSWGGPPDFIEHALDPHERARTERKDGQVLVVLRAPVPGEGSDDLPWTTLPLGVILDARMVVTVCSTRTPVIEELVAGRLTNLDTAARHRFLLQLLLRVTDEYLSALRSVNRSIDLLEDRLQGSLENREVLELLRHQKCLVFFTTALQSHELLLERIEKTHLLEARPEDRELLEDVAIEVRQAIEMTTISASILSEMMDAFASIISNNLNRVMKLLTALTLVIAAPTLVASLYGMNLILPGANHPDAFAWTLMGCAAGVVGMLVIFRRKRWL